MKRLATLLALWAGLSAGCGYGAGGAAEYELKAAFLFNALRFMALPLEDREEYVTVGVVGGSPMEGYLRALESTPIRGKQLRVLAVSRENWAGCCRVLFFGKPSDANLARLLAKAHSANVLTVGDDAEFLRVGGMMALVAVGRQVVIEINASLARSRGVTISSQLLEIARVADGSGLR